MHDDITIWARVYNTGPMVFFVKMHDCYLHTKPLASYNAALHFIPYFLSNNEVQTV